MALGLLPEVYQRFQYGPNAAVYYLVYSGSSVYATRSVDVGAARVIVNREYLDQDWLYLGGEWTVVSPHVPLRLPGVVALALEFLPYWENTVLQECTRYERKTWSYYGATERLEMLGMQFTLF